MEPFGTQWQSLISSLNFRDKILPLSRGKHQGCHAGAPSEQGNLEKSECEGDIAKLLIFQMKKIRGTKIVKL